MSAHHLVLAAPAKVNLHLEILSRRPDGFHELETVFQTLGLADEVALTLQGGMDRIELICSDPALPGGEDNLAYRAAAAVARELPGLGGVRIVLTKRIPHGAGLGGGSSDAGAVLRALARLIPAVRTLDLPALALELGSDVPFFLLGGTAHARGRGERLQQLPDAQGGPVTVLMPEAHLPTPRVFAGLTDAERGPRAARGAGSWHDSRGWQDQLINRLSAPARRLCPQSDALLRYLEARAVPHLLSGSGAACVAFAAIEAPAGVRAYATSFRSRAQLDSLL